MKTPEEIKRGLEHCASYNPCIQCDYDARDWPRCVTRLHGDAIAYIQQLEQLVPRWISVEEGLPEEHVGALWASKKGYITNGTMYCSRGVVFVAEDVGVHCDIRLYSHWMPLPEPPEEDANES